MTLLRVASYSTVHTVRTVARVTDDFPRLLGPTCTVSVRSTVYVRAERSVRFVGMPRVRFRRWTKTGGERTIRIFATTNTQQSEQLHRALAVLVVPSY